LIGLRADVAPAGELLVPEAVVLVALLHALTVSAATATNAPIEYRNGLLRRIGALPSYGGTPGLAGASRALKVT